MAVCENVCEDKEVSRCRTICECKWVFNTDLCQVQIRLPNLALKPRGDFSRNLKQRYQRPHKKDLMYVLQIFFKKSRLKIVIVNHLRFRKSARSSYRALCWNISAIKYCTQCSHIRRVEIDLQLFIILIIIVIQVKF